MNKVKRADIPLPEACLASHIGIVGKTGSGKTYAAKAIAEKLIAEGRRVCVIDPTGAWSGLKLNAEGDGPSDFDQEIVVLGGRHGDVALGEGVGKALGRVVGEGSGGGLPVSVLDCGDMTVGARTRMFADFAEELYRTNRAPLWLFIDECHLFAPQGKVLDPQAGRMLHAANALISGGRSRGLRVVLISQRPQKVHKDSLTQVETLIMMRLIAPQDRKAVEEWVKEHDDDGKGGRGKEVLDSLAKLKVGEGWAWAPAVDEADGGGLRRSAWPRITTYDSSSTPDADGDDGVGGGPAFEGAGVDLEALQALLGEAAEEITRDDPKALKARISELERAVRDGGDDRRVRELEAECARLNADCERHLQAMVEVSKWHRSCPEWMKINPERMTPSVAETATPPPPGSGEGAKAAPRPEFKFSRVDAPSPHPKSVKIANAEGVSGPQMKILGALAWFAGVPGIAEPTREALAFMCGVSHTTKSYRNNLGEMRTAGLIDYPSPGTVTRTRAGIEASPPEPPVYSLAELHDQWLASDKLNTQMREIARLLIKRHPRSMMREELAERVGVSHTTKSYRNNLGRMRSIGLVEYPSPGEVRISDALFPEGLK